MSEAQTIDACRSFIGETMISGNADHLAWLDAAEQDPLVAATIKQLIQDFRGGAIKVTGPGGKPSYFPKSRVVAGAKLAEMRAARGEQPIPPSQFQTGQNRRLNTKK